MPLHLFDAVRPVITEEQKINNRMRQLARTLSQLKSTLQRVDEQLTVQDPESVFGDDFESINTILIKLRELDALIAIPDRADRNIARGNRGGGQRGRGRGRG
jgi:hypothetical protein